MNKLSFKSGGNHHMATLAPDTLYHLKPIHLEWFKELVYSMTFDLP